MCGPYIVSTEYGLYRESTVSTVESLSPLKPQSLYCLHTQLNLDLTTPALARTAAAPQLGIRPPLGHAPCPSRGRLGSAASRLLACRRSSCTRKLRGLRLYALLLEPQPLRSTAVSASQLEQQHDLPSRRPLRGAAERRRRHGTDVSARFLFYF